MQISRIHLLALPLLLPFLVQCAAQQDVVTLDRRVRSVDAGYDSMYREIEDLKSETAALRGKLADRGSVENIERQQAEVGDLLDQLKAEMLKLHGQMDEVTHRNRQLTGDMAGMRSDLGARVDELGSQMEALSGRMTRLETALEAKRQERFLEAAERATETARAVDTSSAEEGAAPSGPPQLEPGEAIKKMSGEEAAPPAPTAESTRAQALYDGALALFRAQRYKEAYTAFFDYLEKFPQEKMAANARFWLGDCLFNQDELELAVLEYQKVITDYPNHEKAAAALLKQGLSFEKLKDPSTAKILYNKLLADYPKSDQVELAEKRLSTLK